jgi:hypothetical protein
MGNFLKDIVNKAVSQVNVVEVIDGLQDGLMKTHEFVGHAGEVVWSGLDALQDGVSDLTDDMQNGILDLSTKLDEYAGLAETIGKVQGFAESGKVYVDEFSKFVNTNEQNTQDWQTRDDKVKSIITYFGFTDNEDTRKVYAEYNDEQLDSILKVIKRYQS